MKKNYQDVQMNKKKPKVFLVFASLSCMLLLTACSTQLLEFMLGGSGDPAATTSSPSTSLAADGEEFPSFGAMSLMGELIDDSIFAKADITMINIWGTFCGPCIDEIPALQELSVWAPGVGAQVIGIVGDAYDEATTKDALDIMTELKADYLNLLPNDALSSYISQFQYVPTTVFVNRDGLLVGEPIVGSGDFLTYQKAILGLLGQ